MLYIILVLHTNHSFRDNRVGELIPFGMGKCTLHVIKKYMAEFKGGNTSLGGTSQGEPHPLYKTLQIKERNAKNRTGLSL